MSENGKPEPRVRIPKAGGHNSASGPSEPRKPAAESFLIRAAGTLFHLFAALSRPAAYMTGRLGYYERNPYWLMRHAS